jgi:hypothetical protein
VSCASGEEGWAPAQPRLRTEIAALVEQFGEAEKEKDGLARLAWAASDSPRNNMLHVSRSSEIWAIWAARKQALEVGLLVSFAGVAHSAGLKLLQTDGLRLV